MDLSCFITDNLFVMVLANTLSKIIDCPSIVFMESLTLSHCGYEPLMILLTCDLMSIRLNRLDHFHLSYVFLSTNELDLMGIGGSSTCPCTLMSKEHFLYNLKNYP